MNSKSLLLLPAALLSNVAFADSVTPEQALDKALSFFQQPARTRGQQAAQSLTLAHTAQVDGETHFYVFNNPAGGYVIIGGDDVAQDVLAYSESGSFDYDQLSPATRWWLGQYQGQIHSAIAAERQGMATRSAVTRAEGLPEIVPLLGGIEWDQMAPYNAYVLGSDQIKDPNLQYTTGCVATATAQVMRYWKYPEHGMFSHTYHSNGQQLDVNFAESTYQWDLMQEKYECTYSGTPEENAVAKLMNDVGIALNMDYGQVYSTASAIPYNAVPYVLCTYFGYSKEMEYLERDQIASTLPSGAWEEIVYGELMAKRPVLYFGGDPNGGGGHAFVCDGYKNGYFHINWGWSGKGNQDYYLLTGTKTEPALAPKEEGTGGNDHGQYGGSQSIAVGLQPDPQSEGFVYLSEPIAIPAEAPCCPQHYEGKLYNPTSHDVKAMVGIQMQELQGFVNPEEWFNTETIVDIPAKQEITISFDVPEAALIPGIKYNIVFLMLDISNPEIPMEQYQAMTPWLFFTEPSHIEGPEYIQLNLFDGLASLCAPFDSQIPEGVEAYTADRIYGDQVIMKQAQSIEAGKSYLLMSEPNPQPIILSGMKTIDEDWSIEPVFKGNLTSHSLYQETTCYVMSILQNGEPALIKTDQFKEITAHKVIVDGSMSDAEILHFNFDESATGIQQVVDRSNGSSLRYNLIGMPVKGEQGFIVKNGRVVLKK